MPDNQPTTERKLAGRCLCGAVHYAVADAFVYAANCHCSNCRRTTGSAFKPFAGIARERLGITKGEHNLLIYGEANANDTHCRPLRLAALFGGPRRRLRSCHAWAR